MGKESFNGNNGDTLHTYMTLQKQNLLDILTFTMFVID